MHAPTDRPTDRPTTHYPATALVTNSFPLLHALSPSLYPLESPITTKQPPPPTATTPALPTASCTLCLGRYLRWCASDNSAGSSSCHLAVARPFFILFFFFFFSFSYSLFLFPSLFFSLACPSICFPKAAFSPGCCSVARLRWMCARSPTRGCVPAFRRRHWENHPQ